MGFLGDEIVDSNGRNKTNQIIVWRSPAKKLGVDNDYTKVSVYPLSAMVVLFNPCLILTSALFMYRQLPLSFYGEELFSRTDIYIAIFWLI